MKKNRSTSKQMEYLGVHVHNSDYLPSSTIIRHPIVKVHLFDSKAGQYLPKTGSSRDDNDFIEPLATKPCTFQGSRSTIPAWDEILTFNCDTQIIVQPNKLIMLEIASNITVSERSWKNKFRSSEGDWYRVAWAFLKPLASDKSLNIDRMVRLQLYKTRASCKISHHSCDLFHLYTEHRLKKYPSSIYVTIKGMTSLTKQLIDINVEDASEAIVKYEKAIVPKEHEKEVEEKCTWSRLPTQSCKIPNTKQRELTSGRSGVSCLKFSSQGKLLACGTQNKIFIYDVLTGEEASRLSGHTGLIYDLDWTCNDNCLLSTSGDCTAVIWSIRPLHQTPSKLLPHPSFVYCGKWHENEVSILTGCKDHVIRYWKLNGDEFELIQEVSGHHGFISALTLNRTFLISGDSFGYIFIWGFESFNWTYVKKVQLNDVSNSIIDSIHLHPGERRLIVTARSKGSFMVDIGTGVTILSYRSVVNLFTRCTSALTPCGNLFISFGQNNVLSIWEVDTGKLIATYDSIFPVLSGNKELSGCVHYHPLEHMMALGLLGPNCSISILKYEATADDKQKLGLILHNKKSKTEKSNKIPLGDWQKQSISQPKENILDRSNTEDDFNPSLVCYSGKDNQGKPNYDDKLAFLIKKIDKVLTTNKILKPPTTSGYTKIKHSPEQEDM